MTVRRLLALVLVAGLALGGCGAPRKRQQPIVLSVGHTAPETYHYQRGLEHMARLLGKKTGGRVELQIFADGAKGSEGEMLAKLREGELSMALVSPGAAGKIDPALFTLDLPYLFQDRTQAYRVLDGRFGRSLSARLPPHGLRNLAWWENGFDDITNNVRPVTAPAGLKGLRLCVPESEITPLIFAQLGATPLALPFATVPEAIASHRSDGQANPIALADAAGLLTKQRYVTLTHHAYAPAMLLIGAVTYGELPADVRVALSEAAIEAGAYQRGLAAAAEKETIAGLSEKGVTPAVPDIAAFRAATHPVFGRAKESLGSRVADGAHLVDAAAAAAAAAGR